MIFKNLLKLQKGIGFVVLCFWLFVIAIGSTVVVKVLPTYIDYYALEKIAKLVIEESPSDAPIKQIKEVFSRKASMNDISYVISDTTFDQTTGKLIISWDYDKEVELIGNVSLVLHFKGST